MVSIWGRTVAEYAEAAKRLQGVEGISAVEVNVSCPNLEDRGDMFSHAPDSCEAAIRASLASGLPTWAKLSPNVTDIVCIARAAMDAGAEALTLDKHCVWHGDKSRNATPRSRQRREDYLVHPYAQWRSERYMTSMKSWGRSR